MFGFKRGGIGLVSAAGAVAILGGMLASNVPAVGEQIGTAVVNGRTVILDDNGTWKYKDESDTQINTKCDNVGETKLCIQDMGWVKLPKRGDFVAMYSYSSKYYFGIISEPYGKKDGVNAKSLREAFIANAAAGAKTTPENIPVVASDDSVPGHPELQSLTYLMSDSNNRSLTFVFHNVFHLSDHKSVQYVFWGVGKNLTSDFKSVITQTLDNTTFR
jgi:hypothetical protein